MCSFVLWWNVIIWQFYYVKVFLGCLKWWNVLMKLSLISCVKCVCFCGDMRFWFFYFVGLCMLWFFGVMLQLLSSVSFGQCCSLVCSYVCSVLSYCILQMNLLELSVWLFGKQVDMMCMLLIVVVIMCCCGLLKLGMLCMMFDLLMMSVLCVRIVILLQVFWFVNQLWQLVVLRLVCGNFLFGSFSFCRYSMLVLFCVSQLSMCCLWMLSELMFQVVIFMNGRVCVV